MVEKLCASSPALASTPERVDGSLGLAVSVWSDEKNAFIVSLIAPPPWGATRACASLSELLSCWEELL